MARTNLILWGILALMIVILIFTGVWVACGFPDFKRCIPQSSSGSS
jgi:hypothetical protein